MIGGFALGGKPSRLGPDLTATGAALAVVLGLSTWAGISVNRRGRGQQPALANEGLADHARTQNAPVLPAAPLMPRARTPLRTRLHPANVARVLATIAAAWLTPALTVAVLFGVFFTSHDGPPAHAFRRAPACVGETNLATCVGDFTAVINGVRTPTNGASFALVSYVIPDGAINTWAKLDGNGEAIANVAMAEKNAGTALRIRVWRGSIVGAELGGSWHWADGNPPGNTAPTVFLGVSFALLLLAARRRIHRRARGGTSERRLLLDDLGQVVAAAGSVVLLAYGFWPGAVLAVATLVWLALSARQSARRRRAHLAPQHAS
jgi:hypothetical protein